jgi:hypothetical protein
VRHLWDWDVSKNRVTSHLLYEGVRSGDVLLVVGGSDMSELCPHPVAGRDDGADFEVFQENVLELHDLFVGDVPAAVKLKLPLRFLLPFLSSLETHHPPTRTMACLVSCSILVRAAKIRKAGRGRGWLPPLACLQSHRFEQS